MPRRGRRKTFKRSGEHPPEAHAFDLAARLATARGSSLSALLGEQTGTIAVSELLSRARNPIRAHGRRVEEMFGYVSAALGNSTVVKREDAGPLYVGEAKGLVTPDYRIVLRDGTEIFAEVKNCHSASASRPLRIRTSYLDGLRRYGALFRREVFLATYWSRWRLWTLLPLDRLPAATLNHVLLPMTTALRDSHMYMLGDQMLGTVFPLRLRLEVDATLAEKQSANSSYLAKITDVRMFARDRELRRKREKNIAWGFMLFGRWPEEGPTPIFAGSQLEAIDFLFTPRDPQPGQDFAVVSTLSSLASADFDSLTTKDGEIVRTYADHVRAQPYPTADSKYRSPSLPLWRFTMKPADSTADSRLDP